MTKTPEDRLEELERRLKVLEDHVALYQALSAYGPSVDSMELDEALDLWEEDGVYDLGDGYPDMVGREGIRAMLEGPIHAGFVQRGCAHTMSLPLLKIDGDTAVGIGYHRLYAQAGDGAHVARLTASRWEWRRQASGEWKAVKRTHRLLDGREEGRTLLRDTLKEIKSTSAIHD
ncbi:nuclear transport factor 2 family protein [Paenarthrobacter nicotinovorans]|uniref:nuclear transport factor 2 family protein n=1 Tax=Paenarthrobacter nicotinovorans TaxID=29320 RepID=UPI003829A609